MHPDLFAGVTSFLFDLTRAFAFETKSVQAREFSILENGKGWGSEGKRFSILREGADTPPVPGGGDEMVCQWGVT